MLAINWRRDGCGTNDHVGKSTYTTYLSSESEKRSRANAKIYVQRSVTKSYDATEGSVLIEVQRHEIYTGDMTGESSARALKVAQHDLSASVVSLHRFRGTLASIRGSFVLQGQEIIKVGNVTATWFVVPGSGTGELTRLRGIGGFKGALGDGADVTLDYWFE